MPIGVRMFKLKVKLWVYVCSQDIPIQFSKLSTDYPQVIEIFQSYRVGENAPQHNEIIDNSFLIHIKRHNATKKYLNEII